MLLIDVLKAIPTGNYYANEFIHMLEGLLYKKSCFYKEIQKEIDLSMYVYVNVTETVSGKKYFNLVDRGCVMECIDEDPHYDVFLYFLGELERLMMAMWY